MGYFHASVKMRQRKNSILALRVRDNWVEYIADVKADVISFFSYPFSKSVQEIMVDGVVAVKEIIDLAKKSPKNCLIFKVDFDEAYDSVN
ncbi:hypothetical protein MTR_3g465920 [Medicago truncatula]|uniref:Reverse transcriptase domain-containing protein n=1 Tax=Medicago truncatula TaxID=3880 RepID=A0A072UXX7_MEDTR|nr:hypothetical protein MTR_3g465920 [Medicago truncatula]